MSDTQITPSPDELISKIRELLLDNKLTIDQLRDLQELSGDTDYYLDKLLQEIDTGDMWE